MFEYMTDPTSIFYTCPSQDKSLKTLYPMVGILLHQSHVQIFLFTKKRYSKIFRGGYSTGTQGAHPCLKNYFG